MNRRLFVLLLAAAVGAGGCRAVVNYQSPLGPRYAVIVMVESGASGGTTCAPIARQIYSALQKWEATAKAEILATK